MLEGYERGIYMREAEIGWVVSMWIDSSQITINERNDDMPYLSWSPYDRVTINLVNDFSDFFISKEDPDWNGTVQRLHLIPLDECQWMVGEKGQLISTKEGDYGLYCIVTARFQARVQDVPFVQKCVNEKIEECLRNKNIPWQCFRSLGAEDFVGIFLANSIDELAEAVDIVKQITYTNEGNKKELFSSVCSFSGLNEPSFLQEPKADVVVRLHLKSASLMQAAMEELKQRLEEKFGVHGFSIREIILRKGCLEVIIQNHEKLLSCFHNDDKNEAIFNGESDFYKKYIEKSRTCWYTSQIKFSEIKGDVGELVIFEEPEYKKCPIKNKNIHPISQFILKEYEKMLNSHRCLWWRPILQQQYETYVKFVEEYTEKNNEAALCTLNNKIQTVLLHINQATAPVYEIPYYNYYYAGSYNDVLRMYYGIIAAIFNLGYELPRSKATRQYKLSFCVDFEAATKVHSNMYKLQGDDNNRFVIFHLPYDAFMNFDKTIKLLVHEVFHYIAPYDRANRNWLFVKIWTILVFEQYNKLLEKRGLKEQDSKNVVEYFYRHYGKICESIKEEIGSRLDEKISNDFTMPDKVIKLRRIPEKICEIICEELNEKLGLWLYEVKGKCEYANVYSELFSGENAKYFIESIRKIALATKEAFCDLNMIFVLDVSLEEYLKILCDNYIGQYSADAQKDALALLLKSRRKSVGSFGFRIGMVIDGYYQNKLNKTDSKEVADIFRKDVSDMKKSGESVYELFYDYVIRIYEDYLTKYRTERILFKKLFAEEQQQWFAAFKENKYELGKLRKAAASKGRISDNITSILNFMNVGMESGKLNSNSKNPVVAKNSNISYEWRKERIVVCDLGDYVTQSCELIREWKEECTWFRGLCSDEYYLLPSLLREPDAGLSLYANQAKYLKAAYYLTMSEATLWTEQLKSKLEHMCLLQHYGLPTSLLDFSEDMLVALHFALNPDNPDDVRKVDEHVFQPKVVLFNPYRYNHAIMCMHNGGYLQQTEDISPFLFDGEDDMLKEYCVNDKEMAEERLREHSQKYTQTYRSCPRTNKYPKPVVVKRGNARIQAQRGTFLAFNLLARPEKEGKNKEEYYAYLRLEKIQEDCKALLEANNEPAGKSEFLKEIYIDKRAVPTIKQQLKTMKITTARTYPELFRVFKEYTDDISK